MFISFNFKQWLFEKTLFGRFVRRTGIPNSIDIALTIILFFKPPYFRLLFRFDNDLPQSPVNAVPSYRSLRVSVGNWEEMTNISVDQVGQFFRDPNSTEQSYSGETKDTVRIVFDLILEEGARKCITVSSQSFYATYTIWQFILAYCWLCNNISNGVVRYLNASCCCCYLTFNILWKICSRFNIRNVSHRRVVLVYRRKF